jgi:hypothetical protein
MAYYEFGGVPFGPQAEEFQPIASRGDNQFSIRHIPHSNANVLDLGGRLPSYFGPVNIRVDPLDAVSLEALSQATDDLTVAGISYPSATLVNLTNKRLTPRGEWVYYTAHWIIG